MLPLHLGDEDTHVGARVCREARTRCRRAWKNVTHLREMDLEGTAWLMVHLCVAPSKVYRSTAWHRQTKGHWARDDPAFFIIQVLLLLAASTAWSVAFAPSVAAALWAPVRAVALAFLGTGALAATLGWAVAGALSDRASAGTSSSSTSSSSSSSSTEGTAATGRRVEWAYCFDVHCNGFFPLFLALHVGAYLVAPLLLARSIGPVATLMSNALCAGAAVHYCYVTFLGYQTLGTLRDARVFLLPVPLVVVAALVASLLGVNVLALTLRLVYH